jgi:hypothetical protein
MRDDETSTQDKRPDAAGTRQPTGRGRDEDTPNQASNKEPAEGSRENTNTGGAQQQPPD